jgi:hypothetical protein
LRSIAKLAVQFLSVINVQLQELNGLGETGFESLKTPEQRALLLSLVAAWAIVTESALSLGRQNLFVVLPGYCFTQFSVLQTFSFRSNGVFQ